MTARGGPGGFFDGQNVWAVGGGWSQYYASTEYWDGASWQAGPDMSTGVRTMGAAFGDGLALKAAGWNGSYQAVTERLAIDCPSTEPVAVSGTLGYGTCPVPVAALASGRARCFLDVTGTNGLDVAQRYTVFLRLDGPDGSRVAFRGEVKLGPGGTAAQQIKLQTQRSDPDGAYTVTLLAEAGSVAAPSGDAVVLASLPLVKGNAGGLAPCNRSPSSRTRLPTRRRSPSQLPRKGRPRSSCTMLSGARSLDPSMAPWKAWWKPVWTRARSRRACTWRA